MFSHRIGAPLLGRFHPPFHPPRRHVCNEERRRESARGNTPYNYGYKTRLSRRLLGRAEFAIGDQSCEASLRFIVAELIVDPPLGLGSRDPASGTFAIGVGPAVLPAVIDPAILELGERPVERRLSGEHLVGALVVLTLNERVGRKITPAATAARFSAPYGVFS